MTTRSYVRIPKALICTPQVKPMALKKNPKLAKVLRDRKISPLERCLLMCVLRFTTQGKPAYFSYSTLKGWLGCSTATIRAAIENLESTEYIEVKPGYSNTYEDAGGLGEGRWCMPQDVLLDPRLTPIEKLVLGLIYNSEGRVLTAPEIAKAVGVHRSLVYKMLAAQIPEGSAPDVVTAKSLVLRGIIMAGATAGCFAVSTPDKWEIADKPARTKTGGRRAKTVTDDAA